MASFVSPKKHLGQHFLKDENIAKKIVNSLSRKSDYKTLIEVGAGTGVLTKYLLQDKTLETFVIEIDRESVAFLKKNYQELEGKIIEKDFLAFETNWLPSSVSPLPFSIIGNFPYNISTQILFKVLEFRNQIPEVVGMFQKEVAERIAAPPGNKTYGILSVLLQAYYKIEYLFTVNPQVFVPPPHVKSGVIRLTRNNVQKLDCDEELFFKVVKAGFNQRRKTLRNSLGSRFKVQDLKSELLSKRAEQLSVKDFVLLTQALAQLPSPSGRDQGC
ncbi:MAG: 16S rRNA (adenine(1518)-N(6)/adenine(1519)-N(6))-dimethyltransferase RsmA [Nitrospirae bacterium]|nr:MAG: 16S rRNA (adenine(1518)-N(6)/adenine(1519)-N(6))-dimethyltransferase RsmA [Nitrospirota bacterium]